MSMSINTRMAPLRWNEKDNEKFEKRQKIHQYSEPIDKTDSKEMATLRKKLINAIEKNQSNIDELIEQYEVLKEKEFVAVHGITSEEYQVKLKKEQYIQETVSERTCFCNQCQTEFVSTRLHPTCTMCGDETFYAFEKKNVLPLSENKLKKYTKGRTKPFSFLRMAHPLLLPIIAKMNRSF